MAGASAVDARFTAVLDPVVAASAHRPIAPTGLAVAVHAAVLAVAAGRAIRPTAVDVDLALVFDLIRTGRTRAHAEVAEDGEAIMVLVTGLHQPACGTRRTPAIDVDF